MPAVSLDPNKQMDDGEGGSFPSPPPPFLSKTYDMVDDVATDGVISWGPQNNSFMVWDQSELSKVLLPKYFKHSNFSSFVRQLNAYGFKKVDPDRWEFANEGFLRGQKHLLKNINRRRRPFHTQTQPQQPQTQKNNSVASCVELGNFGISGEIERVKRDKNVLMQELIKLRKQQKNSDSQLQTMGKRLQGSEHHQKLMMSFLAKTMQRPDLFTQLRQQNENNCQISKLNKKRRLSMEGDNTIVSSPDEQVVKYEPMLNRQESMNIEVTLAMADFPKVCGNNMQDINLPSEIPVAIPCEFPEMQGMMQDASASSDLPMEDFLVSEIENLAMENFIASEVERVYAKQMDGSEKDSNIVGSLFEELLTETEFDSSLQLPTSGSTCGNAHNMDNLTVQIGLLASVSRG